MKRLLFVFLTVAGLILSAAENVLWNENGTNLKVSAKGGKDAWSGKDGSIKQLPGGGFVMENHLTRQIPLDQEHPYLVFEITNAQIPKSGKYSSWSMMIRPAKKTKSLIGNVRAAQPGVYAVKLNPDQKSKSMLIYFYIYNQSVMFKYMKTVHLPDNYIEMKQSEDVIRIGSKVKFTLYLKEPCEDVTFQLYASTGRGLQPFSLNGTNTVNLKPEDEPGKIWSAEALINKTNFDKPVHVLMKAVVLGGPEPLTVFGSFDYLADKK